METRTGPFGNPDGARAALEDITNGFVEYSNERVWGGLATRPDDFTARVIVGRKGSGKTVYLRRQQLEALESDNLFAGEIEKNPPPTDLIVKFYQSTHTNRLDELWRNVWVRAILRSVTSYVLNEPRLATRVPAEVRTILADEFKHLLEPVRPYRAPLGVFGELRAILTTSRLTSNRLMAYLYDPAWDQLEHFIHVALSHCKPLCIYLDGVDEYYEFAPLQWLRCQAGLFGAVMQLLRDSRFGGRLHIVTCVRDIVYLRVLQSEHAMKYIEEPHIRVLNWNYNAIHALLNEKVKRLNASYFPSSAMPRTLASWLRVDRITNESRGIQEPLDEYLLRHTRLLPRDIIVLGNVLCGELEWAKERSGGANEAIRRGVGRASAYCGNEQLEVCAHQIAADLMPSTAGKYGFSEIYTSKNEYHRKIVDDLKRFVGSIHRDRFTRKALPKIEAAAIRAFDSNVDVLSILWLNGLLGYVRERGRKKCVIFYNDDSANEFLLPRDCENYAFHSSVVDAVRIRAVGKDPVIPCR